MTNRGDRMFTPAFHEPVSSTNYTQLYTAVLFCLLAYCITKLYNDGENLLAQCHPRRASANEPLQWEVVDVIQPPSSRLSGSCVFALNHTDHQVVLAFRGTTTAADRLIDVRIKRVEWMPMNGESDPFEPPSRKHHPTSRLLHEGFYTVIRRMMTENRLLDKAKELLAQHAGYRLMITGHSLGGALALIAGLEFSLAGTQPVVVTVAAPRVFSDRFAAVIGERLRVAASILAIRSGDDIFSTPGMYRIYHSCDFVTSIPAGCRWKHVGVTFYIATTEPGSGVGDVVLTGTDLDADGHFPAGCRYIASHLEYFIHVSRCQHGYYGFTERYDMVAPTGHGVGCK